MQQLRNQLKEAQSNGVAVGHFNIGAVKGCGR
jgi:hypothetical protein